MSRFVVVALLVLGVAEAGADTLGPGSGQYGEITRLGRGLKELGLENLLILRSSSLTTDPKGGAEESTTSTFATAFVGGPTFRYFLIDNLSLAANVNLFVQHASSEVKTGSKTTGEAEATEMGVLGSIMVEYAVSLGKGMFLRPGLGGGGFYTSESTPVEGNDKLTQKTKRSGGAGRAQLGLVYYTSSHFNLKAAVDVLMQFGSRTTEQDVGDDIKRSQTLVDVGWNVGFMYVF